MAHGHQDQSQVEEACLNAFRTKSGDEVSKLLPLLSEPTTITTTIYKYGMSFQFIRQPQHMLKNELELVSLLHLAAYWGWRSIVSDLVSVYKCDANRKDEMDHIPLHYAASNGHIDVVEYFVDEPLCNPMAENSFGETPLHFACSKGHVKIAKYLIENKSCSPLCVNMRGSTPLHYASQNGHFEIVEYLISEENCKSSCKNYKCETPLHYASRNGHLKIFKNLIDNPDNNDNCSFTFAPSCSFTFANIIPSCSFPFSSLAPSLLQASSLYFSVFKCFLLYNIPKPWCEKNSHGNAPLHFACSNGHLNIVKYLIEEKHCNKSCENYELWTPLHFACDDDHLDIVKYLIEDRECNPSCENRNQYTPLHDACRRGHLKVVMYLIEQAHCDPSCKDKDCNTPLLLACVNGELSIVQYLIEERKCDPCYGGNVWGNTPLHEACINDRPKIVEYLLSTGRVNPLTKNKKGYIALYCASGKFDIMKLFEPFEECRTAFPVQTFTKLILTGDSGAGKTTIAKLIVRQASRTAVECVVDFKLHSAGIIPHHIQSEQIGNYVMYDFAGQQEYYSSHNAVLEQVMRMSAAIFVCVIDLSESNEKICESLYYWLSFIDNACSTAEGKSHVVIIGSHADQVESVEEKSSLLQKIIVNIKENEHRKYVECIAMDCCRTNTDGSRRLIDTLTKSQNAIAASQPEIHYYSHVVYAFLRTKLKMVGCTLHDLISEMAKENDSSLPKDMSVLTEILTTLSDKGLILFLQHDHESGSSWIIVKTEVLLKEINGTLFAPDHFKEHRDLASNTGIVPVSNLQKVFPNYDSEMVVGFLKSLQFCRLLDPLVLQYTNLQTTPSYSTDNLYFFPGLVLSERSDNLIQQLGALKFGYCLRCMDKHKFLSSRFLHVLLLSVAYKFPLISKASVSGPQPACIFWRNGIFWRNSDNIVTVIELIDKNKCVLVAMSCDDTSPIKHAKLRSSLISLVRHLQQKICPHLNKHVHEFLISPDLIQQYPLDDLPDSDLFDIDHVAHSMLLHKKGVPSYKDSRGYLTVEALPFEPYHKLSSSLVCQLLNPNMADHQVPSSQLQEVYNLPFSIKSQTFGKLKEDLDRLSLFADRSPLVSSTCCLYTIT